jgi:TolB-like protein
MFYKKKQKKNKKKNKKTTKQKTKKQQNKQTKITVALLPFACALVEPAQALQLTTEVCL